MSFVISVSFDAFSLISFLGSISVGISFSCQSKRKTPYASDRTSIGGFLSSQLQERNINFQIWFRFCIFSQRSFSSTIALDDQRRSLVCALFSASFTTDQIASQIFNIDYYYIYVSFCIFDICDCVLFKIGPCNCVTRILSSSYTTASCKPHILCFLW